VAGLAARCDIRPGHPNISVANGIPGSQNGSQRPQIAGSTRHMQPLPIRPSGTSGHVRRCSATLRKCLLSSRSRVRVAVGSLLEVLVRTLMTSQSMRIFINALTVTPHVSHRYLAVVFSYGCRGAGRSPPRPSRSGRAAATAGAPWTMSATSAAARSRGKPGSNRVQCPGARTVPAAVERLAALSPRPNFCSIQCWIP
jgi:hypothetical protein